MPALDTALRNRLEKTVKQARDLTETAARAGLVALAVGAPSAPTHLTEAQRLLRIRLRARGKQVGDERQSNGSQDLTHLVWDTAYEHWHQMLFARFLAENGLLVNEDGTQLSLNDCRELIDEGSVTGVTSAAQLAAQYATAMLPQIFRPQDPVLAVPFAPEHQKPLEQLVEALPSAVFTAEDSLGWVYQFWQSKRKDEVNASEVKIGADELPAVTQLFTEPYMVQFLLHNSLGAWWAAKRTPAALWKTAPDEAAIRQAAAADLGGYALTYLRCVRGDDGVWAPAAGTFPTWPSSAKDLKTLDPCCGSGHFLVALLHLLTRFRMVEEKLSPRAAIDAVLRDNLHGLEIDPRCTQIAAFAVALAAWTFPGSGGHRPLPAPHIACSGLRVAAKRQEWMALADRVGGPGHERLRQGMGRLWDVFQQAPVLGSLLDPGHATPQGDLFTAGWAEVQPLLAKALADERLFDTEERAEIGLTARGLADAAQVMAGRYHLVTTNVPYLGRGKQSNDLADFLNVNFIEAKNDLATAMMMRISDFMAHGGELAIVAPHNWAFLKNYSDFRNGFFKVFRPSCVVQTGPAAFTTQLYDFSFVLGLFKAGPVDLIGVNKFTATAIDSVRGPAGKAQLLAGVSIYRIEQGLSSMIEYLAFSAQAARGEPLSKSAAIGCGIQTGDNDRFVVRPWELIERSDKWEYFQRTASSTRHYDGLEQLLLWESGHGALSVHPGFRDNGTAQISLHLKNLTGVFVHRMGKLPACIAVGPLFDQNGTVIIPKNDNLLYPIWEFVSDPAFNLAVRQIDTKVGVAPATLVKPLFERSSWTKQRYPHGLPKPYTDDPTQWIFHGHPCGSVTWNDQTKRTAHGPTRRDATVLPIVLARLLGYRWPAEHDETMELADEQCAWVRRCADLLPHADADGIVCLAPLATERPAADRMRDLLATAYGKEWSQAVESALLAHDGARTLDDWLRDKAFSSKNAAGKEAGHVQLFQNRPFIWHIWDGRKDGFHAFVNYHQLDNPLLERLIHTYLEEWIDRQEHDAKGGKAGADLRLASAQVLRTKLLAIHQGEQPYDIFVRWKPLHDQPIGWNPDLNDGVRLNIRPWIEADVLRVNLKTKIKYGIDRGKDPDGSPWGPERDNDRHLSLAEKQAARTAQTTKAGTIIASAGREKAKR